MPRNPSIVNRGRNMYSTKTANTKVGYKTTGLSKRTRKRKVGGNFARKVIQVLNQREEKKYFGLNTSAFAPAGGGTTTTVALTEIGQGDTDITRDGDQIYVTSIQLRYNYIIDPAWTGVNYVRVILYQWIDAIAAATAPAAQAILLNVSTNREAVISAYNHDTRYNYRILYDKVHQVGIGGSSVSPQTFHDEVMITKGFNRKIQYEASTTAGTNKFYLMVTSFATANPGLLTYMTKVNFKDN